MNLANGEICDRLRTVRLRTFGARGKARFAERLGIGASTYQQYESTRIPPADVLVRAAEITGCDLVWLLTGNDADRASMPKQTHEAPLVGHVRDLINRRPETTQSLAAFLLLIDPTGPTNADIADREQASAGPTAGPQSPGRTPTNELIPVIGSTAAGPARFWRELVHDEAGKQTWGEEANARLQQLLDECGGRSRTSDSTWLRDASGAVSGQAAALIQFARPDDQGILEFLSCPELPESEAPYIAWRIDGESMAPRYRDGDFVLVSSSQPAVDGYPCVAHQRGQIGANCKIFKQDGPEIVLVPVNESSPSQRFPASDLIWAHRVLFSVRLEPRPS